MVRKRLNNEVSVASTATGKRPKRSVSGDSLLEASPELFWHYVDQVDRKHGKGRVSDPIVKKYGFPPANLAGEANVKFNQKVLARIARGHRTWQLILIGTFQAPDNPWCFLETLIPFLRGVRAQRAGCEQSVVTNHFDEVERILCARYVRGIPAADLASGKRSGTINGYGHIGLYSGEHRIPILPGMSHPQGLRWKLEHWPYWLEHAVLPLLDSWPKPSAAARVDALLEERRFAGHFADGIKTRIVPRRGAKALPLIDLFGGDEAYTRSVISQALLFQELLKPSDLRQRAIRNKYGWGVGPFTIRGLWMEFNKFPSLCRSFPPFDTSTFCPGFVGALGGIRSCNLEAITGVSLTVARGGSVNWTKWDVQVRFAAWMYSLKQSKPNRDLHCTEAEATLCFFLRYMKMRGSDPKSQQHQAAARAIGKNLERSVMASLFRKRNISKARAVIFGI
mmetsp:Transcript_4643/g.10905  ORF Transcript_4643/g.10905 Transcript_4643/m.10905 type:complete len:451 (-) Transcript_4643:83-1435(-)